VGLFSRRYSPDPTHPDIRDWYDSLEKPPYKPPDPVFGAAWPVVTTLLGIGAYRLMRQPRSPERDAALALWAFNVAMTSGWTKIFFSERNITGGAVAGAVMIAGVPPMWSGLPGLTVPLRPWACLSRPGPLSATS
jgi:benzodiazapine receptor